MREEALPTEQDKAFTHRGFVAAPPQLCVQKSIKHLCFRWALPSLVTTDAKDPHIFFRGCYLRQQPPTNDYGREGWR